MFSSLVAPWSPEEPGPFCLNSSELRKTQQRHLQDKTTLSGLQSRSGSWREGIQHFLFVHVYLKYVPLAVSECPLWKWVSSKCSPLDIFVACSRYSNTQIKSVRKLVSVLVWIVDVPSPFDHGLWRSVEEDQFGVKLLFQLQLSCFTHLKWANVEIQSHLKQRVMSMFKVSQLKLEAGIVQHSICFNVWSISICIQTLCIYTIRVSTFICQFNSHTFLGCNKYNNVYNNFKLNLLHKSGLKDFFSLHLSGST